MVVLTTGKTTTSGVLAVLANTTVTGRDVAAVLTSLGEPRRHFLCRPDECNATKKREKDRQRLIPSASSDRPKIHPASKSVRDPAKRYPTGSPGEAERRGDDLEAKTSIDLP